MQQVIYRYMSIRGQKNKPVYLEGKPCPKCGSTNKIQVERKTPKQKNNVIYYTDERYTTYRCWECAKAKSIRNNPNYSNLAWQRKNREHLRAYQREYYSGKYAARNAKNSKRLKERYVYNDMDEIQKFYRKCPKGFHVDHIIPLNGKNISGLHTIGNLQYLLATENQHKYNKYTVQ